MNRSSKIYLFLKKIENPGDNRFFIFMNFYFCLALSLYGSFLFGKIKKLYPQKTILLFPSCCAGDFLFLKYGLDSIIDKAGITDYILVVDKFSCSGSAESLGISNYYSTSRIKLKALTVFHRTVNLREDFLDCYPWVFFDYSKVSIDGFINKSVFFNNSKETTDRFIELGVIGNRTVILSPYENSISSLDFPVLPEKFWNDLALKLVEMKYTVFTNCNEKNNEKPIKYTKKIFPSLGEVSDLIGFAGFCIMVRSGFSDYAAESTAKKIVLYPNDEYYSNWSLFNNGNIYDCHELIYEDYLNNLNKLIEDILIMLS